MARITKVKAGFGSTVNLGNYNSARFDVELEAELEAGDDPQEVMAALHEEAREEVKRQAVPIVRKNSQKLDDIFRHLPEDVQAAIKEAIEHAD